MSEFEMRTMMKMQLEIVKACYNDCVQNFKNPELSASEKTCLQNCSTRQAACMMVMNEAQQSIMARQGGMGGGGF